jgi:hypothetical protein
MASVLGLFGMIFSTLGCRDVTDHNISARDLITLEEQPHDDGRQLSMYLLDGM